MKGLIDTVISQHPIDPGRIYITGLSMGGLATWAMIQEYPDMEHNAWDGAYSDPELFKWLFSQSKKKKNRVRSYRFIFGSSILIP